LEITKVKQTKEDQQPIIGEPAGLEIKEVHPQTVAPVIDQHPIVAEAAKIARAEPEPVPEHHPLIMPED
jgi:hypothetical protein